MRSTARGVCSRYASAASASSCAEVVYRVVCDDVCSTLTTVSRSGADIDLVDEGTACSSTRASGSASSGSTGTATAAVSVYPCLPLASKSDGCKTAAGTEASSLRVGRSCGSTRSSCSDDNRQTRPKLCKIAYGDCRIDDLACSTATASRRADPSCLARTAATASASSYCEDCQRLGSTRNRICAALLKLSHRQQRYV